MKILHINYSDTNGGFAIATRRLHEAFLKNKLNSYFLASEKKSSGQNVITNNKNMEIIFHKIKKNLAIQIKKILGSKNVYRDSISFFKSNLLEKIKIIQPDILNMHWICNEMLSIEQLKKIDLPTVWTVGDMWPFVGAQHYSERSIFFTDEKKKILTTLNLILMRGSLIES